MLLPCGRLPVVPEILQEFREMLPFHSGHFDHVICFAFFPHIENKIKNLKEIISVLKKGGLLSLFHLMGSSELNARHAVIGGTVSLDILPPAHETRELMEIAGFRNIDIEDKPEIYFASGEK